MTRLKFFLCGLTWDVYITGSRSFRVASGTRVEKGRVLKEVGKQTVVDCVCYITIVSKFDCVQVR